MTTPSPPSSADLRLALHVQHHPARAHLLDGLLPLIGPCTVIPDPDPAGPPSAMRTYLACLRAMPAGATHLLVVQDDVAPAPGFRAKAEAAIAEHPSDVVVFFLAGAPHRTADAARRARRRGERWVRLDASDWCPTVCTAWSRQRRDEFLAFVAANPGVEGGLGDDNVAGEFVRRGSVPVWVTVPSLVEHPNIEPSLVGKPQGAGKPLRVAAVPPDMR